MNNLINQLTALPAFYIALMALQVADVATTLRAFSLGGYEKNKVLKKVMQAIGVLPALLLKIAFVAVVGYTIKDDALILPLVVALYVYVVFNNVRVIRTMLKGSST